MRKPLIITVALVLFLLALGSWVYLFFFGAPQTPDEFFTDLGITVGDQNTAFPTEQDTPADEPTLDITGSALQQLTFRPVAGFIALPNQDVRYVEQGTGHVYEINLRTGTEERISNTTVPQVTTAIFSETGEYLFIQTGGDNPTAAVGSIANGGLTTNNLPPTAQNPTFVGTSSVAYTLTTSTGSTGYQYDIPDDSQIALFSIPFRSIITHYTNIGTFVTNRHAPELEGALWQVTGTEMSQVGSSEFGLAVEFGPAWYALAFAEDDIYTSRAVRLADNTVTQLPVSFVPEKCDWGTNTLWCAAPYDAVPHTYLKNWYQGTIRANDALWAINPATETAELLIDPAAEISRQLDITNLSEAGINRLFFINRLDNSLWVYDESLE